MTTTPLSNNGSHDEPADQPEASSVSPSENRPNENRPSTAPENGPGSSKPETLSPSYKLSVGIILLAFPLMRFQIVVGIVFALLGLFLLYQTTTIRLKFTPTALEVLRKENLLKTFPYQDWETWKVFWPAVPILFYFKEVNSIHFLPVLFNPEELRDRLQTHCPEVAL
ncbi:MAG: DUF3119 family protein [Cyanobacteria bacterium J06649_5]